MANRQCRHGQRRLHGIPVDIDEKDLNDIGYAVDTPVSVRVHSVPLRDGLNIMLRPMDLTWTFGKEGLVITTPEKAERAPIEVNYSISDLLRVTSADAVHDIMTTIIAPDTWDEVGGHGKLAIDARGNMTVKQTLEVHQEIDTLLRTLRTRP